MSSGWNDPRPLSPFTTVWRWHITMVTSILHRASGVALGAGALILSVWLFALAAGETQYEKVTALLGSLPGQIVMFGITMAFCFHLLNGVRHLVWDTGRGLDPKVTSKTAWIVIVLSFVLALGVWGCALWLFEAFPGQSPV